MVPIIKFCWEFWRQRLVRVFHRRLCDSKFPLLSRTLLSIMTAFSSVVILMVSIRPQISKSSSPLTKPLRTVPSRPVTIGITKRQVFFINNPCDFFTHASTWWSRFFFVSLIPSVIFSNPFQVHRLLLVAPSPSCSTFFLVLRQSLSIYLSFRILIF